MLTHNDTIEKAK